MRELEALPGLQPVALGLRRWASGTGFAGCPLSELSSLLEGRLSPDLLGETEKGSPEEKPRYLQASHLWRDIEEGVFWAQSLPSEMVSSVVGLL